MNNTFFDVDFENNLFDKDGAVFSELFHDTLVVARVDKGGLLFGERIAVPQKLVVQVEFVLGRGIAARFAVKTNAVAVFDAQLIGRFVDDNQVRFGLVVILQARVEFRTFERLVQIFGTNGARANEIRHGPFGLFGQIIVDSFQTSWFANIFNSNLTCKMKKNLFQILPLYNLGQIVRDYGPIVVENILKFAVI